MLTALLTGCVGQLVPTQSIDKVGIDVVLAAAKIEVIPTGTTTSMHGLGMVIGHSCKNKTNDPDATQVGATDQVKIAAAQLGATAISDLECEEGGLSLIKNCWHSWECKAMALNNQKNISIERSPD